MIFKGNRTFHKPENPATFGKTDPPQPEKTWTKRGNSFSRPKCFLEGVLNKIMFLRFYLLTNSIWKEGSLKRTQVNSTNTFSWRGGNVHPPSHFHRRSFFHVDLNMRARQAQEQLPVVHAQPAL